MTCPCTALARSLAPHADGRPARALSPPLESSPDGATLCRAGSRGRMDDGGGGGGGGGGVHEAQGGAWCENRPEGALPGAQRSGGGTMGGGGCRGGPSPRWWPQRGRVVLLSAVPSVRSLRRPPCQAVCLLSGSGSQATTCPSGPRGGRQLIEWQRVAGFASCITTWNPAYNLERLDALPWPCPQNFRRAAAAAAAATVAASDPGKLLGQSARIARSGHRSRQSAHQAKHRFQAPVDISNHSTPPFPRPASPWFEFLPQR